MHDIFNLQIIVIFFFYVNLIHLTNLTNLIIISHNLKYYSKFQTLFITTTKI